MNILQYSDYKRVASKCYFTCSLVDEPSCMPGMGILGPKAGAIITAWQLQHAATCKSKLHDGIII